MDTFMLIFTSGTSGDPKAVKVTHVMVLFVGPVPGRTGSSSPPTTSATWRCRCSTPTRWWPAGPGRSARGRRWRRPSSPRRGSCDDIRRYGATYMNYVGKPLAYMLATPERPDDADNPLRVAFGNEASDRDIDEFGRRFDCTVWDGFGSTENAVIITREPGTPKGSMGKGFGRGGLRPGDRQRVCRSRASTRAGTDQRRRGRRGAGQHRGRGYFTGYYNDQAANAERMRHGMYWSGDLAYRDADGWIYLAGRTADWMRVDGENLAAAPIERILLRLPGSTGSPCTRCPTRTSATR